MHPLHRISLSFALTIACAVLSAGSPQADTFTFDFNTLTVHPDDFEVTAFVPRNQLTAPAGLATVDTGTAIVTFVASSNDNTPIKAIVDIDRDWIADSTHDVFSVSDLQTSISLTDELHSVAVDPVNQHVYIGSIDHLMVCLNLVDYAINLFVTNNNPTISPMCNLVAALPAHMSFDVHGRLSLAFDEDGDRLCYSNGFDCDVCTTSAPFGSLYCTDMTSLRPLVEANYVANLPLAVTNGVPQYTTEVAQGVRYSGGLEFHPETQELWFTEVNGVAIDGTPDFFTFRPDAELNVVEAGDSNPHFGFPFVHTEGTGDPWLPDLGSGNPINDAVLFNQGPGGPYKAPQQALGPHAHPLGLAIYDRDGLIEEACARGESPRLFPADYDERVFVAEWGSFDAFGLVLGYRIMTLAMDAANSITDHSIFIDGFRTNGDINNPQPFSLPWARPHGIEVAPDGSVLISDDFGNWLFRVQYVGADAMTWSCPPTPVPIAPPLWLGGLGLVLVTAGWRASARLLATGARDPGAGPPR